MKKIIYVCIAALTIVSCKQEPKDYVTFSGKITNQNSDSLVVFNREGYKKVIKVNQDGTFKDTFKVTSNEFSTFDGAEYAQLYLENGDDVQMTLDAKQFDETIAFTGAGSDESSVLAKLAIMQESLFEDSSFFNLEKKLFTTKLDSVADAFKALITTTKNLDSSFVVNQTTNVQGFKQFLVKQYEAKYYLNSVLAKGTTSPKFVNYENNKGGETSLDDLKGKYVYIDLWATWCGPCIAEIPFLKAVEKEYHSKNITFVSISVDRQKDYDTWKKMIVDEELGGVQLYSKEDITFMEAYKVSGIPRFILIDPQGNIVSADAPRPSSKELKKLFASLNI